MNTVKQTASSLDQCTCPMVIGSSDPVNNPLLSDYAYLTNSIDFFFPDSRVRFPQGSSTCFIGSHSRISSDRVDARTRFDIANNLFLSIKRIQRKQVKVPVKSPKACLASILAVETVPFPWSWQYWLLQSPALYDLFPLERPLTCLEQREPTTSYIESSTLPPSK